jgi:CHAD domain-containing protein
MKWESSLSADANAQLILPRLAADYFKAGRKAAGKNSPKALHRFRISTKRFRYALELFEPVYGPSLKKRLKVLHKLQDALGKISDYKSIIELVNGDQSTAANLEKAMKRKTKEFRKEWKSFDSRGQLQDWKDYLANSANGKRPTKAPAPPHSSK